MNRYGVGREAAGLRRSHTKTRASRKSADLRSSDSVCQRSNVAVARIRIVPSGVTVPEAARCFDCPVWVVEDAIHHGPLVATAYPGGLRISRESLAAYQRVR